MTAFTSTLSNTTPSTTTSIETRPSEIFQSLINGSRRITDRIFMAVMVLQWFVGIAIACWLSPYSWNGLDRQVHLHVTMAIVFGGVLSSLPIALILLAPGRLVTRIVVSISQMVWAGFLVQLSGGRIETHFHVFVSLAFIAFYRDYRAIAAATVVVVVDHVLAADHMALYDLWCADAFPLRTIEHVAWVLIEDLGLMISMQQSLRKIRELSHNQAIVEAGREQVELEVLERTAELRQKAESLCLPNNRFAKKANDSIWPHEVPRMAFGTWTCSRTISGSAIDSSNSSDIRLTRFILLAKSFALDCMTRTASAFLYVGKASCRSRNV